VLVTFDAGVKLLAARDAAGEVLVSKHRRRFADQGTDTDRWIQRTLSQLRSFSLPSSNFA
jgi:hypothetical protein